MMSPEMKLFCRIDGLSYQEKENQRIQLLSQLGLLGADNFPIFDEAVQMTARHLEVPICILSVMDRDVEWLKSASGLSRLGLMNQLAISRQISKAESLATHVIDSQQSLVLADTLDHPAFRHHPLVEMYGIRTYLGVPLLTSEGQCIGVLAVMDTMPRQFSCKDVEFLELEARWSISELERHRLQEQSPASAKEDDQLDASQLRQRLSAVLEPDMPVASSVRIELISQLAQELRTPLTSIMGMTSVLGRKIYGPLTTKQQEYIDIMRDSGQCLLSLVDEIAELGSFDDRNQTLNLASVDIEMICQQAIKTLSQFAQRQDQTIQLSVEPGPRIWLLDKDKVRQMLYHLTFSIIRCSCAGSTVKMHVSRKDSRLNIAVWVSNPWLSNGFSSFEIGPSVPAIAHSWEEANQAVVTENGTLTIDQDVESIANDRVGNDLTFARENLALLMSRQLAALHGGEIRVQGSSESGLRYVISLPTSAEIDPAA
jgi:hypothetical protein